MLLSSLALAVVAAFVLSVVAALLVSTRRAAALDQGLLLDLVIDGGTRTSAARRDLM